jgi:8-oxo-dGTP pyrophosphatase MutT (NUDIX family)
MNKKILKTAWVILFRENKVLLVKHLSEAWHITWIYWVPAGRVEKSETDIDCALRELKEETWLEVKKDNLVKLEEYFIADIKRKSWEIKTFWLRIFISKIFYWELIWEKDETLPEWVKLSDLEELNLLPNVKKIINKAKTLLKK